MLMTSRWNKDKILAYCALGIGIAQVAIIIMSWIISAIMYDSTVRSLLSPEGVRWFLGHFVDNMLNPLLVWILILSIAGGCFVDSGLAAALGRLVHHFPLSFRERLGLWIALVEFGAFFVAVILLAFIPHAVLLSVIGEMFPSSFSASLIPIIAFCLGFISVSYGITSGKLKAMKDVFNSLTVGITKTQSCWLYYILLVELYRSLCFAFF
jgi:p-aminobenzoyl-glutamate transporter AbgT